MAENAASPVRASLSAVVGVVGAVGLMLLLVTWAATIGPQEVVTDAGHLTTSAPVSPISVTATPEEQGQARPEGGGDRDVLFAAVAIVASALATVVMLAALLTVVHWLLTRDWRRRTEVEPEEVDFDALDAPARLAAVMVADAVGQRRALAAGSPRNAIVECWHRFEVQAEAVGVRRLPWETSSEFTLRLLDRVSADAAAVVALAELYRDARHSRHEITEENRNRAIEALDVIHRSLGSPVMRA